MDAIEAAFATRKLEGYIPFRLSYGTFVSLKYRYIYMETPKNACSTTKMILWQLAGLPMDGLVPSKVHPRERYDGRPSVFDFDYASACQILYSGEFFRFCFLRDPLERLVSGYKNKISDTMQPYHKEMRSVLRDRYNLANDKDISFDMFVEYVCSQNERERDPHWASQYELNLMKFIDYDFVGTVENYAADMGHVLSRLDAGEKYQELVNKKHNKSVKMEIIISDKSKELIQEHYSKDYELYNRYKK